MTKRLLRRREVEHLTGYSRSTIYRLMDINEFPRPVRLSARSVAWVESDIQAWIESRISESAAA